MSSTDTISTADLVVGGAPTCTRCHRADRRGLTGWLGIRLCGLCLLMAKARRGVNYGEKVSA